MFLIYKSYFLTINYGIIFKNRNNIYNIYINQNLDLYKSHCGFLSWIFSIIDHVIIKHNHAHSTSWRIVKIRHAHCSLVSWSILLSTCRIIVDGAYSALTRILILSCLVMSLDIYYCANIDHVWSCKGAHALYDMLYAPSHPLSYTSI